MRKFNQLILLLQELIPYQEAGHEQDDLFLKEGELVKLALGNLV